MHTISEAADFEAICFCNIHSVTRGSLENKDLYIYGASHPLIWKYHTEPTHTQTSHFPQSKCWIYTSRLNLQWAESLPL